MANTILVGGQWGNEGRGRIISTLRVLPIFKPSGFDGMLIPDQAPRITCGAPWHAGMAYARGWLKAAL